MKASQLTTRPARRARQGMWSGFRRSRRRGRTSLFRLEYLEDRICLSAFYDIDFLSEIHFGCVPRPIRQ